MDILNYEPQYLPNVRAHFLRHWAESGVDGPHFLPFDLAQPARPRGLDPAACELQPSQLGWQRWLLVVDDSEIRGHACLKSDPMAAGIHRCELGMGLERNWRGQGQGTQLLHQIIKLAQNVPTLDWLDLRVMAENATARQLYEKLGFKTLAVIEDRFRIGDVSLDEVMMAVNVANAESKSGGKR